MKAQDLKVGMVIRWTNPDNEDAEMIDRIILKLGQEKYYTYTFKGAEATYFDLMQNLEEFEPVEDDSEIIEARTVLKDWQDNSEKYPDDLLTKHSFQPKINNWDEFYGKLKNRVGQPFEEAVKNMREEIGLPFQPAIDMGRISVSPAQDRKYDQEIGPLVQQSILACRVAKAITGKPYRVVFMDDRQIDIEPIPDDVFTQNVPATTQQTIQDRLPPEAWD